MMAQRNPLTNISYSWIGDAPSKNTANTKNCPSDKSAPTLWSSCTSMSPTSQYQATIQPSLPYGKSAEIHNFEKRACPLQSSPTLGATGTEHKTNQNQYFAQGYPYSLQPYYAMGWNHYGYTTYPQGYHLQAQQYHTAPPIQKRKSKPIQPREPYRSFLVELNEENVKSTFNECMVVCDKEKSIKAFEDLLAEGAKFNSGWLKKVFVEGDIPKNLMSKFYVWSILLTFDAQISVGMRGKLVHAWGTNLDRLRSWRCRMKESTSFLQTIAKHQIDFREHKTNPFLIYSATFEIQKIQGMIAELETTANQLEEKVRMERALQLNKEKIAIQKRCIDALRRTERTLEEENKKLTSRLGHWKNCYSKLNRENEDLKALVNLPNKEAV